MKTRFYSILFVLALLSWQCQNSRSSSEEIVEKDTIPVENASQTAEPAVEVNEVATARARLMAGLPLDNPEKYDSLLAQASTREHYKVFNQQWEKLEQARLSKMRQWRDTELTSFQTGNHTLFYPFSGPDFLNAYEYFPNCDNYLMFGLEPNGKLVDMENIPPRYLASLREALAEIFQRNYFITSFMSGDLWGKGVLPVVNIFLARTNNDIVDIKRFYLDQEGEPHYFEIEDETTGKGKLEGIMVEFKNRDIAQSQKLFYFGTDVQDDKMQSKQELVTFIKSFPDKITFIKSASYILHNTNFKVMRELVLNETSAVLQDDTGIRYTEFVDRGWDIQLYGKYARPVADFGGYTYQPPLRDAYATSDNVKPLNFTYGYHWNTDNSSVMLCRKPG